MESDNDPIARLWVHAMRTELDAVVLRFEAQLKQHVALTAGARRDELDALEHQLTAFAARVKESERAAADVAEKLSQRDQELARMRALHDEAAREIVALREELEGARAEGARSQSEVARLEGSLRDLGTRVQSLDEQFSAEKAVVSALAGVAGTLLFDVAQLSLGQAIEHTPACYGALKARKPDVLLAAIVRERGRTVARHPLTVPERAALVALADAAGCELIEVAVGARFSSASMEKVGTRSEPADEDHVLECVMPGLRLAGTQGAVAHPRVIVATA